jgi:hypothetical protein
MFKAIAATSIALAAFVAPAIAQSSLTPNGVWQDRWGTTFTFELCGDGTALCGVLNELKGNSATEENLALVGKDVVQANQTAPNKWEGQIALNGGGAKAIVTLVDADTLEITGCQAVLCQTLEYERI